MGIDHQAESGYIPASAAVMTAVKAKRRSWMLESTELLREFKIEGYTGTFLAIGGKRRLGYAVAIFTDEGFQVVPKIAGRCWMYPLRDPAKRDLLFRVRAELLLPLSRKATPRQYEEWVIACRKLNDGADVE